MGEALGVSDFQAKNVCGVKHQRTWSHSASPLTANVSAETTKGDAPKDLTPMTTRDQPPSMWTIAGVIGAPALSAAGAALVGFNRLS